MKLKTIVCAFALALAMPLAAQQQESSASVVDLDATENQAVEQITQPGGESSAAAPVPAPAAQQASPAPAPANDGGNLLMHGVMALLLLVPSVVVWLLARGMVSKSHNQQVANLEALNQQLQSRIDTLEDALRTVDANVRKAQQATTRSAVASPAAAPRARAAAPAAQQPAPLPVQLYLSRPDAQGNFPVASSSIEPGNSIFVLHTTQSSHSGTFEVINDAQVHRIALMMPTENLTRVCTGNNIQVSGGKRVIVTEQPGQARLENGQWHCVTPAVIRYE